MKRIFNMPMELTDNEKDVIAGVKEYATAFLENMGGFYPFAIGLNKKGSIISIAASDGSEFPESQILIDLLEKSIPLDIKKKKYTLAAICIDVFIKETIDNIEIKKDAIELRFIGADNRKNANLFYKISSDKKVMFGDVVLK